MNFSPFNQKKTIRDFNLYKNNNPPKIICKKHLKINQVDMSAFLMIQKNNIIIISIMKINKLYPKKTWTVASKKYQGFQKVWVIRTFKKKDWDILTISYLFPIQILIKKGLSLWIYSPRMILIRNKGDLNLDIETLFPNKVKGEAVLQASQNWFSINMLKMAKIFQIALSLILNQDRNSRKIIEKWYLVLLKKLMLLNKSYRLFQSRMLRRKITFKWKHRFRAMI